MASSENPVPVPTTSYISLLKEFLVSLIISVLIILILTSLASKTASSLSPESSSLIQTWITQKPENRFDDWMDGIVLANILYKTVDSSHSLWTYFLPSKAPPAGWELLGHVLSPRHRESLAETIRNRQGELLHRYWTGHIVLTALALYVYTDPAIVSKVALSFVLLAMLIFMFAWSKRLGLASAIVVGALLLGSGTLYIESLHTHAWGLAFAFVTTAYTAKRVSSGKSFVAPAVVGAVFASWVGYDYVFPTIAFSLMIFLHREDEKLKIGDLSAPLKFTAVFLVVTVLMMVLRIPVAYFFENCMPSEFLSQIVGRFVYRLQGEYLPQEVPSGAEISRRFAFLSALPAVNLYLFNLGGRFMPLIQSVWSYVAYQALPIVMLMGILVFRNSDSQLMALRPAGVAILSVIVFHLMLIVLVNHACVHPWMHARYMIFSLAMSWGVVAASVGRIKFRDRSKAHIESKKPPKDPNQL
jgi:hypothetical protein